MIESIVVRVTPIFLATAALLISVLLVYVEAPLTLSPDMIAPFMASYFSAQISTALLFEIVVWAIAVSGAILLQQRILMRGSGAGEISPLRFFSAILSSVGMIAAYTSVPLTRIDFALVEYRGPDDIYRYGGFTVAAVGAIAMVIGFGLWVVGGTLANRKFKVDQ